MWKPSRLSLKGIEKAGYRPGDDVAIALDPANQRSCTRKTAAICSTNPDNSRKSSEELIDLWEGWVNQFPIVSIEDGLGEQDWEGWQSLTQRLGSRIQLVGDDAFVTNPAIIAQAIKDGVGNSTLIKVNQIGSVTETLEAIQNVPRCGLYLHGQPPFWGNPRRLHRRPGGRGHDRPN